MEYYHIQLSLRVSQVVHRIDQLKSGGYMTFVFLTNILYIDKYFFFFFGYNGAEAQPAKTKQPTWPWQGLSYPHLNYPSNIQK